MLSKVTTLSSVLRWGFSGPGNPPEAGNSKGPPPQRRACHLQHPAVEVGSGQVEGLGDLVGIEGPDSL